MNVGIGMRAGKVAIAIAALSVVIGGERTLSAQTMPSNPLRPVRRPAAQPSPERQAEEAQAARAAMSADTTRPAAPARTGSNETTAVYRPVSYDGPITYGSRAARRPTPGFVPRHRQTSLTQAPTEVIEMQPEVIGPGAATEPMLADDMLETLPGEGEYMDPGCCDETYTDCGGCGTCASCCCLIPCPCFSLDNFEFFAGVQGFTGPLNRGETGSFGFHYGFNWAAPVPCMPHQPIGMQIGYRGVSSNYSGASFSEDSRNQSYITAGLFRRVDWGLQGGVVVDILTDEWYYDALELTQLRGELSWVYPQCHEIGFWFTAGTKNNDVEPVLLVNGQRQSLIETYEPTDLMAFFYRRRFEEVGGGYGRIFAGFTGSSEGLLGADFKLPLTPSLALQSEFTYLVPKDGNNRVAHLQEAWNVGITLVWYPGCRKAVGVDYFRPLFDVADNGDFIVRPLAAD